MKYACRNCSHKIIPFFSLGDMPSVNLFLKKEDISKEKKFDLTVGFCSNCYAVQLTEIIPPQDLFVEYTYLSSMSTTMLKHAEDVSNYLTKKLGLNQNSLVVELASNDGYLLQYFQKLGIKVLGVDPAKNIAKIANEKGIETIADFFSLDLAKNVYENKGKKADLIYGANVLAHVPGIVDFLSGVKFLLNDKGTAVFEFPYIDGLFEGKFDTIYHEHVFYYSALAIKSLCKTVGLELYNIETNEMQGGSLFIYLSHPGAFEISDNVKNIINKELSLGYDKIETYIEIKEKADSINKKLKKILDGIKNEGKRIVGYGAAAKGTILLNYFGVGNNYIDYIIDKAPTKQGLYSPGVHLKVEAPEILNTDQPDYILILPWNISSEIIKQLDDYKQKGGKFIIPVPDPLII